MINKNFDNKNYYNCILVNTMNAINIEIPNKEYILQHAKKYGYRCISWHPHYIMTDWVKDKNQALINGDNAIKQFYDRMAKSGEVLKIVYDRMIAERENKNDKL